MSRVLSKYNCTTNILSSDQTFNGIVERIYNYGNIIINIKSDQDSDTDGIKIYFGQSSDNLELTQTYSYLASDNNKIISISNYNSYFKLVYINGNVAQTEFSIQTFLSDSSASSGSGPSSDVNIKDSLGNNLTSTSGSLDVNIASGTVDSNLKDGNGNIVTSTIVSLKRGLDVNIISGGGGGGGGLVQLQAYNTSTSEYEDLYTTDTGHLLKTQSCIHTASGQEISGTTINTVRGLNIYDVGYEILGSLGNMANSISLTAGSASTGLNINKTYLNNSVLIYEDTSTAATGAICIQISQDNITYQTLTILYPVVGQTGKRVTSSILTLKAFNYIRILNNSASTYNGIVCSLYSS